MTCKRCLGLAASPPRLGLAGRSRTCDLRLPKPAGVATLPTARRIEQKHPWRESNPRFRVEGPASSRSTTRAWSSGGRDRTRGAPRFQAGALPAELRPRGMGEAGSRAPERRQRRNRSSPPPCLGLRASPPPRRRRPLSPSTCRGKGRGRRPPSDLLCRRRLVAERCFPSRSPYPSTLDRRPAAARATPASSTWRGFWSPDPARSARKFAG